MINRARYVKHTKKYPLDTTLCERHKTKMAKGCDHDGEGCYRTEDEQIVSTEHRGKRQRKIFGLGESTLDCASQWKRVTESRGATRSSRLAARLRASLHRLPSQQSILTFPPDSWAAMDAAAHILLLAHPFMETFWPETSATSTRRSTVIPPVYRHTCAVHRQRNFMNIIWYIEQQALSWVELEIFGNNGEPVMWNITYSGDTAIIVPQAVYGGEAILVVACVAPFPIWGTTAGYCGAEKNKHWSYHRLGYRHRRRFCFSPLVLTGARP